MLPIMTFTSVDVALKPVQPIVISCPPPIEPLDGLNDVTVIGNVTLGTGSVATACRLLPKQATLTFSRNCPPRRFSAWCT